MTHANRVVQFLRRKFRGEPNPDSSAPKPLLIPPAPITPPRLRTLAALIGVIVVLAVAKELLIPIALAGLVGILLHPLVERVEKLGARRVFAVMLVFSLAMLPVAGIAWLVFTQFMTVVNTLPEYTENIRTKLQSIQGPAGRGFERIATMLKDLQGGAAETGGAPPTPVKVVEEPPDIFTTFSQYAGPIIHPIAIIGIMLVFAIFILIMWDDIRDRIIRLISAGRLSTTTAALDELSARIGSFLRAQFLINLMDGTIIGLGLYFLGVPNAALWGFLAAVLRYIPYLGAITAAALPLALTIATSEGWEQPLKVLIFLGIFEIISNNFIEPVMYGTSTGISSLAMLLAAIFWGWLWGIPGLLLATPLTVCMVVAGRHVPQLTFLNVLLGDQPVLDPPQKLYQRLLAMDAEEAGQVVDDYLKDHTLAQVYDDLLLPALRNADIEYEDGTLDEPHQRFIIEAVAALVEDASFRAAQLEQKREAEQAEQSLPTGVPAARLVRPEFTPPTERIRVLCIPARDEADAVAGMMIEMLAPSVEVGARVLQVEDLGTDLAAIVHDYGPDLIFVSSVPPHGSTHARARAKMVRRRVHDLRIVAGVWGIGPEASLRSRLQAAGFETVVGSMQELVEYFKNTTPKALPDDSKDASGPGASRPDSPGRASA